MDRAWTYVVFTDIGRSTEPSEAVRRRHLDADHQALERDRGFSRLIEGRYVRRVGDDRKAEFTDPWYAIDAALGVSTDTRALRDGLATGIRVDAGPIEEGGTAGTNLREPNRDYHQTVGRAKRIMEVCPSRYILCSEDLLDALRKSERDALQVHGPLFVKLRGFVRPTRVQFIGQSAPEALEIWQAGRPGPGERTSLDQLRTGHASEILAAQVVDALWRWFRDTSRYEWGRSWFSILKTVSRWLKWAWLDLHGSIGLGDTSMVLRQPQRALRWAKRACELPDRLRDRRYQAMADYHIGHCFAQAEPTAEAETDLRNGHAWFEDFAVVRMAGSSALYLGRCLWGVGRVTEAEHWLLSSLIIFRSGGPGVRRISYALTQVARLRAAQGRSADAQWYLDQAYQLYPDAVTRPVDDTAWEEPLGSIRNRAATSSERVHCPRCCSSPTRDGNVGIATFGAV